MRLTPDRYIDESKMDDSPRIEFTAAEKLACIEREVRMRAKIYPNRILTGRMSAEAATREIDCMKSIADDYRQLVAKERLL